MAEIRVNVPKTISNGFEVVFHAPCDCSEITGLNIVYPNLENKEVSKSFAFKDAHGNDLSDVDNLFTKGVYVKVILNVTDGEAYIQNADTNKYLEGRLLDFKNHIDNKKNPHSVTKSDVGLDKVDNKSSETIRNEMTKNNVTRALGYVPLKESDVSIKSYSSLEELGLTKGSETIIDIVEAMEGTSQLIMFVDNTFNSEIYPMSYGVFMVFKSVENNKGYAHLEFYNVAINVRYSGLYQRSLGPDEAWQGWNLILTDEDVVDNLTSNDSTKLLSAKQGKALKDLISSHSHSKEVITKALGYTPPSKTDYIVRATSTDGKIYKATHDEITSLYDGLSIIFVPNMNPVYGTPYLNLNNLGDKTILRRRSDGELMISYGEDWMHLRKDTPVLLIYNSSSRNGTGAWIVEGNALVRGEDLYSEVPIEKGGTGATTKEGALKNFGLPNNIQYGTEWVDLTANEYKNGIVTFEKAFSTAPIVIVWLGTPTGAIYSNVRVWLDYPTSKTQFKYYINSNYNGVLSNCKVLWLAFELL